MSAAVVVVGSYNQDYAWRVDRIPAGGETRRGDDFRAASGGKGFNQAIASVRQDVATAFVCAVGDDAGGRVAQRLAADEGIDARWQIRADAATGSACILVEADGENRIIVALGANERLDPFFVRCQAELFENAHVVLVQLENNLDAVRGALELGAQHSLLRVLNPAPMRADIDAALFNDCDVLTPNETEFTALLERIAGIDVDAASLASHSDAELHAFARALGGATVVITLGAHGCFVSHADGTRRGDETAFYRIGGERVTAIDTTGAGDAFSGALAAACARLNERSFRDAVRYANRAAALSTERIGAALSMPRYGEVLARFAK